MAKQVSNLFLGCGVVVAIDVIPGCLIEIALVRDGVFFSEGVINEEILGERSDAGIIGEGCNSACCSNSSVVRTCTLLMKNQRYLAFPFIGTSAVVNDLVSKLPFLFER